MSVISIVIFMIGIVLIIVGSIRTKREARRFSNAVFFSVGLSMTVVGLFDFWREEAPGLATPDERGYQAITTAGEMQSGLILFALLLMMLLGLFMIGTGIRLLRRENKSLANSLPLAFGLLCVFYPFIFFLRPMTDFASVGYTIFVEVFLFLRSCALYVPFILFTYFLYALIYSLLPKKREPDYVVVLGARLIGDKVSPLVAKRLDRGIDVYRKYGERPMILVSGGQGKDEVCSEAAAMKRYLLEQGISESKILCENQSTTTMENLSFSKRLIEERTQDEYFCAVVTNNFHVLRSVIWSRAVGLPCVGYGCKTALYYLPAAALREAIAFAFSYKLLAFSAVFLFFLKAVFFIVMGLL